MMRCPLLCLGLILCSALGWSAENEKNTPLTEPGIVLSFDDSGNLPLWAEQIELFQKYGARATFFVTNPAELSDTEAAALKKLADSGMAIGVHGVHHVASVDYVNEHGTEAFLADEVRPALETLRNVYGLNPTSFAYPYSQGDARTDAALQTLFCHVRTGYSSGKPLAESDPFFIPLETVDQVFTMGAWSCDMATEKIVETQVYPALERLKERSEIIVFLAHKISPEGQQYFIKPDILEMILKRCSELGLRFYTFDDLPSRWPEQN
ncbi:MAG: polysaccharide deacetylase family protein [Thermoguttaceae bacterium]|nr:polysaccharide deacetylase family protein [Thermoguttaceae bacterium]